MYDVKDVAYSALQLGILLRKTASDWLETGRTDVPDGEIARAAETLRMIEAYLQDSPPQRDKTEYFYDALDLILAGDAVVSDLRGGGSFLVYPFGGPIDLGPGSPPEAHERCDELFVESIIQRVGR